MSKMTNMMYKLQLALKQKNIKICINTTQFYSEQFDGFIKCYHLRQGKKELFKSCSQIQIIKFMKQMLEEAE